MPNGKPVDGSGCLIRQILEVFKTTDIRALRQMIGELPAPIAPSTPLRRLAPLAGGCVASVNPRHWNPPARGRRSTPKTLLTCLPPRPGRHPARYDSPSSSKSYRRPPGELCTIEFAIKLRTKDIACSSSKNMAIILSRDGDGHGQSKS